MKQEIKHKWSETLRSGEFKQIQGAFFQTNDKGQLEGCCATGALYKVLGDKYNYNLSGYQRLGELMTISCGILDNDEEIKYLAKIIEMNDEENKTFAEIADYVELNF